MNVSSPILPPKIPTLCVQNSVSSNTLYSPLYISLTLNIILILIPISFLLYHSFGKIKHNDATISCRVVTSFSPNPPPRETQCCDQIEGEKVEDEQEKVSSTETFKEYIEPRLLDLIVYDGEIGETTNTETPPPPECSGQINGKLVEDAKEAVASRETISPTMRLNESIEPSVLDFIVYDNEILKNNHTKDKKSIEDSHRISDIKEMEEALDDEDDGQNSLDTTWKIIVESGGETETRKLRKCETWDVPPRVNQKADAKTDLYETWEKKMRKLESFNDSVFGRRRGGLRRGESLTRDEVNLASEAFIKNFRHSIRLQKQESLLKSKIRA